MKKVKNTTQPEQPKFNKELVKVLLFAYLVGINLRRGNDMDMMIESAHIMADALEELVNSN